MRHFERRIWDDQKSVYAYVYFIPCPSIFFDTYRSHVSRSRRWKPLVEFDGATYEGSYDDNVYSDHSRGPGMGPFYFAQGRPEH